MSIERSNSKTSFRTPQPADRALRRNRVVWRKLRFGVVLLMAGIAILSSVVIDLTASPEGPHATPAIRLATPDFLTQQQSRPLPRDERPLPDLQIIPRYSNGGSRAPVIQSRQQLNQTRPSPPYAPHQAPAPSLTPNRFVSDSRDVPPAPESDVPSVPAGGALNPNSAALPNWSMPPIKTESSPEATEESFTKSGAPPWSLRPEKSESTPSEYEKEFQRLSQGNWSELNGPPAFQPQQRLPDGLASETPSPNASIGSSLPEVDFGLPTTTLNENQIGNGSVTSPLVPEPISGIAPGVNIQDGSFNPNEPAPPQPRSDRIEMPGIPVPLSNSAPPSHVAPRNAAPPIVLPSPEQYGPPGSFPSATGSHPSMVTPSTPGLGVQGMRFTPIPGGTSEMIDAPPQAEPLIMSNGSQTHGHIYHEHSNRLGAPPVGGHSIFGMRPGTSGFRATVERDAAQWMSPYTSRANLAGSYDMLSPVAASLTALPPGFSPWWDLRVRQSTGMAATSIPVEVGQLLQDALLYSPQVTAIKAEPEVQYRVVTQEAAKFDWTVFLDTTYDDLNDPVGNELTTGNGQDRLITRKVNGEAGVRQKNLIGGEVQISQIVGHENQNSRFFIPNNQASTRLELSYRQPLLDGAGRCYNESEIVLARIRANSSEDEVVDALQDHLIEVTKAYWTLYRARAEYLQRQRLLGSAQNVLSRLEGRSQVDTIPRQVLRARAAVARAQTRIQRTIARVKDAEAQLRLLVNSPAMLNGGPVELTPIEAPRMVTESADLRSVLQTALMNRPDISEAIRKMRASSVRLGVSKTELLPRLDFLVETYVADLSGNSNLRRALRGQYFDNRPGYTVGLEFEYPLENRAARAKLEQRQWELKRSINVFRATVEKSLTDVEIANREVATAYSEMLSRFQSMQAAENETAYLQDRFDVLPAAEDSAVLLLEDLLDSYERIADEESSFVQAQVDHAVALVMLKKELGVLLKSRHSRPAIESNEQQWIERRMNSAVDVPVHHFNRSDRSDRSAVVESFGHQGVGATAVSAPRSSNVVSRPMPATPTTWSRPAGSSFR